MVANDPAQILTPPADMERMATPKPAQGKWGETYRPFLPGGRRHWVWDDGNEVIDPRWDYDRSCYMGTTSNGAHWESAWTPALTWHVCSQVAGYCRVNQGKQLHAYAAETAQRGTIIEIGTAKGLSATWIGLAARSATPAARVTCVDTFHGPPHAKVKWQPVLSTFKANMEYAGLRDVCTPLPHPSREANTLYDGAPVSMIYIDGFHSYAEARFDYQAWGRFAVPGAVICFDDCTADFPGVMRLQRELLEDPALELLGRTGAMISWRLRSAPS